VVEEKGKEDMAETASMHEADTAVSSPMPNSPRAVKSPEFDTAISTGSPVKVPDNDCARLMYYLNSKYYFSELIV